MNNIVISLTDCTQQKVDDAVESFTKVICDVADPLFSKNIRHTCTTNSGVRHKRKKPPWMCAQCVNLRKEFFYELDIYRANVCNDSRDRMVKARNLYTRHTRKCRLRFDCTETQKLLQARVQDARLYWKMLKAGDKKENIKVTNDEFYDFFKNISSGGDHLTADDDVKEYVNNFERGEIQVMFDELESDLTDAEVMKAIGQLKLNKAAGPDLLINEFFQCGKEYLCPYLTKLFNAVYCAGYFPRAWSEGVIVPVHKKGSIHKAENYRGITLLSVLGKLFTRTLNNRLTNWAEEYQVYIEAQGGFRSGHSTVDSIFTLHNIVTWFINSKKKLYCTFIDYRKAFDYVTST
jgi:hypothetical protein